MRALRAAALCGAVVVLLMAGCAGDAQDPVTEDPTTTTAPTTDPEPTGTGEPTGTDGEESLPGEASELPWSEGEGLLVVGVASDDTLNVRTGPGESEDVMTELAPLEDGLSATGRNRTLEDGSWWSEVETPDGTGWVSTAYVAAAASPRGATPEHPEAYEGMTAVEVAQDIARGLTSGAEPEPTTVISSETAQSASVDVTGLADDSVMGARIRVDATGPELAVEVVDLCARGVSDGLCL